jgi:hypothetical protein
MRHFVGSFVLIPDGVSEAQPQVGAGLSTKTEQHESRSRMA